MKLPSKMLSEAVYLISIGSNDYLSPFFRNSTLLQSYPQKQNIHMVIGNLTVVIKVLPIKPFISKPVSFFYALSFWFVYVSGNIQDSRKEVCLMGPLGCLQDLESKLKGFKYSLSNFYALLEERMNNPSKYGMPSPPPYHMFFPVAKFYLCYNSPLRCRCKGFKEGKIACCGSGPYRGRPSCVGKRRIKEYELCSNVSEYVFFDSGHPTDRAYQQMGKLIWSLQHYWTLQFESTIWLNKS